MGRGSLTIPLTGYTTTQAEKNSLKTWARNRTKLVYDDDENSNINVIIASSNNTRKASRPGYYEFSFTIIQVE